MVLGVGVTTRFFSFVGCVPLHRGGGATAIARLSNLERGQGGARWLNYIPAQLKDAPVG